MLALQVAAGIVLAYVIIVNQAVLLRFAKSILALIILAALAGLVIWAGTSAYTAVSPALPRFLGKLGNLAGALFLLACVAAGGVGLLWMVHETCKRPSVYFSNVIWLIMTISNTALVLVAGWLSSFTLLGDWIDAADHWSRANGHADAASVSIFAISCLWPFVVVASLRLIRGRFIVNDWVNSSEGSDATKDENS